VQVAQNVFSADDFVSLAKQLGRIKGRFIMSINDVPEIRDIFSQFELTAVQTKYSVGNKGGAAQTARAELLVSNS